MPADLTVRELADLVGPLRDLCREAGELICGYYHSPDPIRHRMKGDESPLTRADTESHALLLAGLRRLAPGIPVLSEESAPAELAGRRDWGRLWMVDPLDGTREFLAGTGEFTVNIALIVQCRPVLGLLYLPLEEAAYVGIPGQWAQCQRHLGGGRWQCSALSTRALEPGEGLTVLASRRHRSDRLAHCLAWLEDEWGPLTRRDSGSALKFCQLAEGAGDFYPRFAPCSEWDTAAGQAVLEAAGGALLGLDGRPLRYNCRDSLLSPDFYGIADPGHPLWRRLLRGTGWQRGG